MGDGFGDFLMELDDLTDMVEGKSDRKAVFHGRDADEEEDDRLGDRVSRSKQASKYGGHLIDEDEQEQSDIDDEDEEMDMSGSDYDEESDGDEEGEEGTGSEGEEGSEMDEMEEEDGDMDEQGESNSEDSYEGSMSGSEEDDVPSGDEPEGEGDGRDSEEDYSGSDDGSEDGKEEGGDTQAQYTYRPAKGEDIYGRSVAAEGAAQGPPGKYVPPALRKAAALAQINEVGPLAPAIQHSVCSHLTNHDCPVRPGACIELGKCAATQEAAERPDEQTVGSIQGLDRARHQGTVRQE